MVFRCFGADVLVPHAEGACLLRGRGRLCVVGEHGDKLWTLAGGHGGFSLRASLRLRKAMNAMLISPRADKATRRSRYSRSACTRPSLLCHPSESNTPSATGYTRAHRPRA